VTWEFVPAHEYYYIYVYVVSRKKYKVCLIVGTEKDRTAVDVNLKKVFGCKTKVIFSLKH
jgi:hypothetical protein